MSSLYKQLQTSYAQNYPHIHNCVFFSSILAHFSAHLFFNFSPFIFQIYFPLIPPLHFVAKIEAYIQKGEMK